MERQDQPGAGPDAFRLIRLAAVMAEIRVKQDPHLHKQELWMPAGLGGLFARPSFTPCPQESMMSWVLGRPQRDWVDSRHHCDPDHQMSKVAIIETMAWLPPASVSDATTTDQPQHNGDHGNDQKDVNQATQCGGGKHTKEPQDNQ